MILAATAMTERWVTPARHDRRRRGADTLLAGEGDDLIFGADAGDILEAGLGDDTIFGGAGSDIINGDDPLDANGRGNDLIYAGDDPIAYYGGRGEDTIFGGAGDDVLVGGYPAATGIGHIRLRCREPQRRYPWVGYRRRPDRPVGVRPCRRRLILSATTAWTQPSPSSASIRLCSRSP